MAVRNDDSAVNTLRATSVNVQHEDLQWHC